MKYILKKDLPFAKAGAEVIILDEPVGNMIKESHPIHYRADSGCLRYLCNKGELSTLIFQGWIEEVKPREWNIIVTKDGSPLSVPSIGIPALDKSCDWKIIKVREVME